MFEMVDGTGIIGVDMICPLGVSAPQPPNYDRVELEGAGMLVLPNSLDAPLERLELGGKTEQVQTTGAQLLPFPYVTGDMTKNGVTFAVQEDGGIKVTGTATEYVIFNIAKIDFGAESIFNNSTGNGKVLSGGKDNVKIEYHGLNKNTYLSVEKGLTVNTVIYPQLQNGNSATPYEPYTGGKPSPSPEYPQEIKNSGKWNEEKQKYEIEVVLSGKNLLDITACEDGKTLDANGNIVNNANALLSDFIPCFSKTSYCRVEGHFTAVSFYDVEKNKIGFINQYDPCFATPDKCRYFRFSLNKTKADYEKAVANVGTALMDYEPHKKPQFLTLTSDRPLTKWDKLVEQDGQIGWLYNSVNETIDGKTGKWSIQPASKIFYRTDITFPIAVPFCSELLGYDYSSVGYKKDTGITINYICLFDYLFISS